MSFVLTQAWLKEHYGSRGDHQEREAIKWLNQYGQNVPGDKLRQWAAYKHLVEYQVNTNDIVEKALGAIGSTFNNEWQAHKFINLMRVPLATSYEGALEKCNPSTILELGTGGDSAISTSVFVAYLSMQQNPVEMISIDRNPLGVTMGRYGKCPFWNFHQSDSLTCLNKCISKNKKWDMVFIDTIHSYTHTMKELNLAAKVTDNILLDDATFQGNDFDPEPGGVKKAIVEWKKTNKSWEYKEYHNGDVGAFYKKKIKSKRKK